MRTAHYILIIAVLFLGSISQSALAEDDYIYEELTMDKLSQLYWAMSAEMLDIDDDSDIDHFLRINECDIYRDYSHNEFEWKGVREAGRDFIRKNIDEFPVRFVIMQPILLSDYEFEKEGFNVQEDYKIDNVKRFVVRCHRSR